MTTDEGKRAEAKTVVGAYPVAVAELVQATADAITLAETWIANATHLREQKEDLMVALREEGFELAAAMRMIDRRDRKLAEAKLLAEHWIRSSDNRTRRLGADLKQVLDG